MQTPCIVTKGILFVHFAPSKNRHVLFDYVDYIFQSNQTMLVTCGLGHAYMV
jgi:hypothetical protein